MEKIGGRFTLIYFVLLAAGLAVAAIGYRFSIVGFFIAGILWILVTPFSVKSTVPSQIRTWSVILLLIGGLGGMILATLIGESIKTFVGVIGGILLGGIGGMAIYGVIFSSILHMLFDAFFPKISTIILFAFFTLGAIWGATSLSSLIPKYFEIGGGGMLVGGVIGAILGILFGAEIIKRQTE